jgi:hypothetical protein
MSGAQAAVRQVDVDGAYTLTATSANHLARALPGERNTAFTGALIALLRTGTLDGTPLTLGTLYRPLRAELARRDLPAPQCRQDNASAALALRRDPSAPPFSPTPVSPTPVSWGGANSARPPRLPAPPGRSWQRHLGRVLLRVGVILFALVLCLFEVGVIGAAATNGYHGDIWTPILSSFCVVVFLGPCVVFLGFEIKRVLEALRD